MKKLLFSLALVSALFTIVSCSKSFDPSEGDQSSEAMTFTATIENNDTKTTLGQVGDNKYVNWVSTDEVSINGSIFTVSPKSDPREATLTIKSGETEPTATFKAYYPTALYNGGTPTLPAVQTYNATNPFSVNPMYAEAATSTETLSFKNICAVLKITTSEKVYNIEVSNDQKLLSGAFDIETDGSGYKAVVKSGGSKKVYLTGCAGNTGDFYVAIPTQDYSNTTFTIKVLTETSSKTMTKSVTKTLKRSNIYTVTFNPTASVEHQFTVASGTPSKKVYFSKGNLYWDGAYHFESAQYAYPTAWNGSHVGHFFWSKEASISYAQSYSDASAQASDDFFCGENKKLTVDGTSGWYALSSAEWNHLLKNRSKASSLCKKGVTVCGNSDCFIFAPDGFTGTIASSYDASTWATAEAEGLVCLPAAGYRSSSKVYPGGAGEYWSSTPLNYEKAYYFKFNGSASVEYGYRAYGLSVRLVR